MNSDSLSIRFGRFAGIAVALCALASVFAATSAMAADPVSVQYGTSVTDVSSSVSHSTSYAQSSASAEAATSEEATGLKSTLVSGLPFTGLDLVALFAVALALAAAGFALRRLTVSPRD